MSYRFAHILFGGFTQRYGRAGNGMYQLFDELYRRYSGPDTLVEYFPWYVGPGTVAEAIDQLDRECRAVNRHPLIVHLIGFSYGGQTAADCCWSLADRFVYVDQLDLCDAICRRWRFWPFSAFSPMAEIYVPFNVRRLTWCVQRNSYFRLRPPFLLPRGHRVVPAVSTATSGPHVLEPPHDEIDADPWLHARVLQEAERLHLATEPPTIAGNIADEMSRRAG